jgi:hypothetical protein
LITGEIVIKNKANPKNIFLLFLRLNKIKAAKEYIKAGLLSIKSGGMELSKKCGYIIERLDGIRNLTK